MRTFLLFLTLTLFVGWVFVPSLPGAYIYDDSLLIENSPMLTRVRSVADVFAFVHQPTKPVFNVMLALGQLLGGGSAAVQRALTLLLHIANSFLLLVLFRRISNVESNRNWALAFAVVFALLPIHSETLYVVQFRGEPLLLFFGLLSLVCCTVPEGDWKASHFFALGWSVLFAGLSKEVGVVLIPLWVLGWGVFQARWSRKHLKRIFIVVTASSLLSAFLVARGYIQDLAGWRYSYAGNVGASVLPLSLHVTAAMRTLLEGILKTLSGQDLTFVRIISRGGVGAGMGWPLACVGLCSWLVLVILAARRFTADRFLWFAYGTSSVIYLLIPNVNIGSEHYYYSQVPWILFLLFRGVLKWVESSRTAFVKWIPLLGLLWVSLNAFALKTEMGTMTSIRDYYERQWQLYPEASATWSSYAMALLATKPKTEELPKIGKFLDRAVEKFGRDGSLVRAENLYYFLTGDLRSMRILIRNVENSDLGVPPMETAKMYGLLATLEAYSGLCDESVASFSKGIDVIPDFQVLVQQRARVQNGDPSSHCGLDG